MRLDALEAFVTVVEAGSFSNAAERLGIARSMVSRRIAELEAHLGAQLLQRTTRRLSLTEAGRDFYERASRILIDLAEAEQSVASGQAALRGRLRLAAPLSFGVLHLAAALDEFALHHPELQLDIELDDRTINLVEEGFDLAIRIGHLPDSTLVARPLAPIRFAVCASAAYLRQHGEPSHPDELSAHEGLVYGNMPEHLQWKFSGSDGSEVIARPRSRLRANNGDLLLRAAIDALGIIVAPTFISHQAIASGALIPILRDWQPQAATLYAVYASRRHLPARVRLLIDHLAQNFGDPPYWDRGTAHNAPVLPLQPPH
ncbi:MAG TPA: LysR family transcriptional regulator [Gammaproteobacteria bacterium]